MPCRKDAAILDVGCGWGHTLQRLYDWGYTNLTGIDMQPEAVAVARRNLPPEVRVLCADATTFLLGSEETYDRVLFFHVLEHFPVPEAVTLLAQARQKLKPGGLLVAEVPNMSSLTALHALYNDVTHVTGYQEYSLAQVFDRAGYNDITLVCPIPKPTLRGWRWRDLAGGTTLGWWANRLLHRVVYFVTNMGPRPHCYCPALLMTGGVRQDRPAGDARG